MSLWRFYRRWRVAHLVGYCKGCGQRRHLLEDPGSFTGEPGSTVLRCEDCAEQYDLARSTPQDDAVQVEP